MHLARIRRYNVSPVACCLYKLLYPCKIMLMDYPVGWLPRFPGSCTRKIKRHPCPNPSFFSSFFILFLSRSFIFSVFSVSLSVTHDPFNPSARGSRSNRIDGSVSVARAWKRAHGTRAAETTDGVKKSLKRIRDAPNLHYRFCPQYARAPLGSLCIFISVNPEDPFFSFFPLASLRYSVRMETATTENERLLLTAGPLFASILVSDRGSIDFIARLSAPLSLSSCNSWWIENYSPTDRLFSSIHGFDMIVGVRMVLF